jgi:isoquinoline 1-oxidoreductase beta subunit
MRISRRSFVVGIASTAIVLARVQDASAADASGRQFHPLLRFEDGRWTLLVARSEIGQGVITALVALVAEGLDVPIASLAWDHDTYDPAWPDQGTSASISVFTEFNRYRAVAHGVRRAILELAATAWNVSAAGLTTASGTVVRADGARMSYADVLSSATLPRIVPLTRVQLPDWRPRERPPGRLEGASKVDGRAVFGADVRPPGMRFAAWTPLPHGDELDSAVTAAASSLPGVVSVLTFPDGVATVAINTWTARRARDAVRTTSRRVDAAPRDDAEIATELRRRLEIDLPVLRGDGPMPSGQPSLEATYAVDALAHAPMEPSVATALCTGDAVTLWLSTQHPERARQAVATAVGVSPSRVTIHKTFVGGGFGRKTYPDVAVRAARIAARMPGTPVQMAFGREDEFALDYVRPPSVHRLRAHLAEAKIAAFQHDAVAPAILAWYENRKASGEPDPISLAGVDSATYAYPAFRARGATFRTALRAGIWRSIGHFSSVFATECFLDEAAHALREDPIALRLRHLATADRTRRVLEHARRAARWDVRERRRALGVALFREHFPAEADSPAFETIVATVAELRRVDDRWRLVTVRQTIDCGQVINPVHVRAQMEGGVAWALSALTQRLTVEHGRVQQANFHQYTPVRLGTMPNVEVDILPSTAWPGGVGEKGVPGVVPAVLNAWFAATGERIRALPWRGDGLSF